MKYVVVLLVAFAAGLAVAYALYRNTPAARWRRKVLRHLAALDSRAAALRAETGRADAEIARLHDEGVRRHLQTLPVERLADYPGIGVATVEKVKAASGPRIADVLGLKFHDIPDIGQARSAALFKALLAIQTDARARFDAGGCPEAQEFKRKADAVRAADAGRADERTRELFALDEARKAADDLAAAAREVSFPSFLIRQNQSARLADEIARPFPVVVVSPAASAPAPAAGVPALAPTAPQVPVTLAAKPAAPADLFRAALASTPPAAPLQTPTEPPALARLRAVAGFGLMVAKADGRVAQAERKAVRAYLDRSFGHDPALARSIDPVLEQTEKAIPTEGDAVRAIRAAVPESDWLGLVRFAVEVAAASGEPNAKEREALARITAVLGGPTIVSPKPPVPPRPDPAPPDDHRAVLEIPADAALDPDLIRRRFAYLTDKLDPAKAAAFGPDFVRMAEQKRAAVRAAAEALIAPFGEPLERATAPPPTDIRENALLDDVFG